MTIHRTEVRKVLLDYEAKPADLSLEYFERALDDKVFLAGGAIGAFFWLKDVMSLRYKDLSTCQSFDLVSIAGGINHQQRDDFFSNFFSWRFRKSFVLPQAFFIRTRKF
jgi:hypothetical protein